MLQRLASSLYDQLSEIRSFHFSAQIINKIGYGTCGEQSQLTAIKILREAQRKGLDINIQKVRLESSTSKGLIRDHMFLLINANLENIVIKENSARTKELLESIQKTSGFICDPWHDGRLIKYNEDTSGFYHGNTVWNSVMLTTFHFDWKQLAKLARTLPSSGATFFCKELSYMELDEEPENICEHNKPQ